MVLLHSVVETVAPAARRLVEAVAPAGLLVKASGAAGLLVGTSGAARLLVQSSGAAGLLVETSGAARLLVESSGSAGLLVETSRAARLLVGPAGATGLLVKVVHDVPMAVSVHPSGCLLQPVGPSRAAWPGSLGRPRAEGLVRKLVRAEGLAREPVEPRSLRRPRAVGSRSLGGPQAGGLPQKPVLGPASFGRPRNGGLPPRDPGSLQLSRMPSSDVWLPMKVKPNRGQIEIQTDT